MLRLGYKYYVLGVLTLVFAMNSLDSSLMILLLQPIKEDLHLSDSRLGFLTGIAFGLFYATLGLPIARWVDRGNRATITSLAIGVWGLTVMCCLFVSNYAQLVAARVAAGIGESGCMPATYSLIGDYFPRPAERTRAMAIYWLANPVAPLVSFVLGGWLNETLGWRVAFFAMGVPGLLIAALVKLTVRDPRPATVATDGAAASVPGMTDVLRVLWRQPSARHLALGIILLFTMGYGLSPWYAASLIRRFGMRTGELGVWLGLIFGFAGIAGTLFGGYLSAQRFANDERGQMRLSALVVSSLVFWLLLFLLLPQKQQALLALIPLVVVANFILGPAFALLQRLVPNDMRATAMAVVMLFANLIGLGIGPQMVGVLSDGLRPVVGNESLPDAMLIVSLVTFASAYQFWRAGQYAREDLARAAHTINAAGAAARAGP